MCASLLSLCQKDIPFWPWFGRALLSWLTAQPTPTLSGVTVETACISVNSGAHYGITLSPLLFDSEYLGHWPTRESLTYILHKEPRILLINSSEENVLWWLILGEEVQCLIRDHHRSLMQLCMSNLMTFDIMAREALSKWDVTWEDGKSRTIFVLLYLEEKCKLIREVKTKTVWSLLLCP